MNFLSDILFKLYKDNGKNIFSFLPYSAFEVLAGKPHFSLEKIASALPQEFKYIFEDKRLIERIEIEGKFIFGKVDALYVKFI